MSTSDRLASFHATSKDEAYECMLLFLQNLAEGMEEQQFCPRITSWTRQVIRVGEEARDL